LTWWKTGDTHYIRYCRSIRSAVSGLAWSSPMSKRCMSMGLVDI
jgi:hypothetical protein